MVVQSFDQRNSNNTAFLFPGQGSHHVGMGYDLYRGFDLVKDLFHRVDEVVGAPLMKFAFEGPEEELRKTVNAQPAIMAVSLACWLVMKEQCGEEFFVGADFAAGHSLGEYTALVAAAALEPLDAIYLVRERGRLMQEATTKRDGAMAAVIGLDEETVQEVCRETGAEISNINSEEQIVVSGERQAIGRTVDLLAARGAKKAMLLQVGGAFHSSLMEPAVQGMTKAIEKITIQQPRLQVVANCTGLPLTSVEAVRTELINQVCTCVQWRRSMDYLLQAGVKRFVEVGPGRILSGLARRMSREAEVLSVGDSASLRKLTG